MTVNDNGRKTGQAAYDVMSHVIVSGVTSQAFSTGKLEAQDFFGN